MSLAAIQANPPSGDVAEIRTAPFAGKLYWLASRSDGTVERLDAGGRPASASVDDLKDAAQRVAGDTSIASEDLITDEDAYYFSHHDQVVLPAYRVILNDAESTRYYFDPKSVALVRRVDATDRERRWLFDGLHRIDFTAALRWRPVWDLVVIFLLLGGIAVSGTGTYLALSRIKRDLSFARRVKPSPVPESAE